MKTLLQSTTTLLALIGGLALVAAVGFAAGGVSARPNPSALEVTVARAARHWLIPGSARSALNPVPLSPAALDAGLRHFADHCAGCHGNDGRGDTALGRGLYPRSPDMRQPATQDLSEGELFWIIENGIKLTGMPAWGDPESEDKSGSWQLVHFIRHLPQLSADEGDLMTSLNPLSREEFQRELEIERFLAGETPAPPPPHIADHTH